MSKIADMVSDLEDELQTAKDTIRELNDQIDAQERQIGGMESTICDQDEHIGLLRIELEEIKVELNHFQCITVEQNAKLDSLYGIC